LKIIVDTIPAPARTTNKNSKKCKKVMGLDRRKICGRMIVMNKVKYWLLVVASLIKAFSGSIALFGFMFMIQDKDLKMLLLIVGICNLGWIEIKLPEKPVND